MIRIGILGAADIAKRRFLPALLNSKEYKLVGIAAATSAERKLSENDKNANEADDFTRCEKASALTQEFGGRVFTSYEELIQSDEVDAVYIPLPPSLHFCWGKKALEAGKHVYMEKPFTTCLKDTEELVDLARKKGLAVFENYGFTLNDQMKLIDELVSDKIGELRLVRGYFGFPKRADNDFRHVKSLGGGALLDCGGYTLKAARHFLGNDMKIIASTATKMPGHDVDGWGSVMAVNDDGLTAQLSFGMDNQYKCELEVWGSIGTIHAPRIFTPPAAFVPKISLTTKDGTEYFEAKPGDAFANGINVFLKCVTDDGKRDEEYAEILTQGRIVSEAYAEY